MKKNHCIALEIREQILKRVKEEVSVGQVAGRGHPRNDDLKLQDTNGVLHEEGIGGIGLNKLDSVASSLAPGGKVTGDLIFEVTSAGTSKMTLHFQPLFSFGKPVSIKLQ